MDRPSLFELVHLLHPYLELLLVVDAVVSTRTYECRTREVTLTALSLLGLLHPIITYYFDTILAQHLDGLLYNHRDYAPIPTRTLFQLGCTKGMYVYITIIY
jgi:hypothetical protein